MHHAQAQCEQLDAISHANDVKSFNLVHALLRECALTAVLCSMACSNHFVRMCSSIYWLHAPGRAHLMRRSGLRGLKDAVWHAIAFTLNVDVIRVSTLPARIIMSAFAFVVIIVWASYTANLAANLTVKRLETSIQSLSDLKACRLFLHPA